MTLLGFCGAKGFAQGLCHRAEGKERDGMAGIGGVAEGTKEVRDVPRGWVSCDNQGCGGPLQWPERKGGRKGVPAVASRKQE